MFGHAGKVAGGIAGFAAGTLGGGAWPFVLALGGVVLGALFDGFHDPDDPFAADRAPSGEDIDREARAQLARAFGSVLSAVLGRPMLSSEIDSTRSFFVEHLGFDESDRPRLEQALAEGPGEDLEATCRRCADWVDASERLLLLEGLYAVATSGGQVPAPAAARLDRAAALLGIAAGDAALVRRRWRREALAAFQVLGLSPDASVQEIKQAWRALAARHHPDRVMHLGPLAIARATERFAQIKQAYEAARRERGF